MDMFEKQFPPFYLRSPIAKEKIPEKPSIRPEKSWMNLHGLKCVAGIDEAGRGPLAGPVVAGAVVFDPESRRPVGINDSKKLTDESRQVIFDHIISNAIGWGIGLASSVEIDQFNILGATHLACKRAVFSCNYRMLNSEKPVVDGLVTDALHLKDLPLPQNALIKGDSRSVSIAAASILAKVTRDRLMRFWDQEFPEYGFAGHKGYPTRAHYAALEKFGTSTLHRFSFRGTGCKENLESLRFSRTYNEMLDKGFLPDIDRISCKNIDLNNLSPYLLKLSEFEQRVLFSMVSCEDAEIVKKNTNFSLESAGVEEIGHPHNKTLPRAPKG